MDDLARWCSAVSRESEAMALEMRQTLILEKQGKDWKIVHEHFSTPLQMHEHAHD